MLFLFFFSQEFVENLGKLSFFCVTVEYRKHGGWAKTESGDGLFVSWLTYQNYLWDWCLPHCMALHEMCIWVFLYCSWYLALVVAEEMLFLVHRVYYNICYQYNITGKQLQLCHETFTTETTALRWCH